MKCKYCGKWVGLFKSAHEECEKAFQQKQAEIKKERARLLALVKSTVISFADGADDVTPINNMLDANPSELLISFDEIADQMHIALVEYINANLSCNKINNKTFDRIKKCKSFFDRLGKSELYDNIIIHLYQQSLQLSLKGTHTLRHAYRISSDIWQFFKNDENSSALYDCEENAMYLWAKECISDKDLYMSDEQYNALVAYSDEYCHVLLGSPYHDEMLPYSKRLQYAYILNKLRHNEFADDYFLIEEAKNHIILGKGEKIVWAFDESADTYQSKIKKRYVGSSAGASIRIAKGLYVRTGGYEGETIEEQMEDYLGCGTLVITTDNLICYMTHENGHSVRIPFDKIVSIKSTLNGFVVEQGNKQKDLRFEFYEWSKEDYSFMLKVMQTDNKELGPRRLSRTDISPEEDIDIDIEEEIKPKKKVKKSKKSSNKEDDPSNYPFLSTIPLTDVILNEGLRNKCYTIVDKLYAFYKEKCYEEKFTTLISQVLPPTEDHLNAAFLRDLFQCIIAVSGKVDLSTPHGIVAIMAIGKTRGTDFSDSVNFICITNKELKGLQLVADITLHAFNTLTGVDTLFFNTVFSFYSKPNQKKYVDLMIQLTNCLIEIGNPQPTESVKFLEHLEELKSITKGVMQ